MEQALLPQRLEELAGEEATHGGYRAYLQDSLDTLLKEAKDKFKGYDSCSTPEHADLACRKVGPLFVNVLSVPSHVMCSARVAAFIVSVCREGWKR